MPGETVRAIATPQNLNVHSDHNLASSVTVSVTYHTTGTVQSATDNGIQQDGYYWWYVYWPSYGVYGWSVEDYLEYFGPTATPTPVQTSTPTATRTPAPGSHNYVIITNSAMKDAFQALATYKAGHGYPTARVLPFISVPR